METITLTRQQLYEHVWSEPMTKLAKRCGLTDVGLAKICRTHDIPCPPRGYWAKKRVGISVRKTRLPNPDQDDPIELRDAPGATPETSIDHAYAMAKDVLQANVPIELAETLHGAHKLVRQANPQLKSAEMDEHELIVPPSDAGLDVQVSKASLHRALRIMDALLKACEQRGYPVSAGPQVEILGEKVSFGILEQLDTVREQPEEHDLDGRYEFGHSIFTSRRVLSGRLQLCVTSASYGSRHAWGDSDKHKLENCLTNVIAGFIRVAGRQKDAREAERQRAAAYIEEERRRQEEARRRAELQRQHEQEQARVKTLVADAVNWSQARQLRAFIAAAAARHIEDHGAIAPDSEFAQWHKWALEQADRLDPLCESPPSILD